jgi:hypothetical protein
VHLRKTWKVTAFSISLFIVGLSVASGSESGSGVLPSLGELEKLPFVAAPSDSYNPPNDDVNNARGLFLAYRATSQFLSRYHDPVLTRGPQA